MNALRDVRRWWSAFTQRFYENPNLRYVATALVLGIVAFVRHEDQRLVACAIALGAGTICTQYFLTAVLILAFTVLVGVVLARSG